jgi:hypothetical protein
MSPWNIKTIYRTVRDEFPYVYVFAAEDLSSDTILIASLEPLRLDLGVVERAFRDPTTRAEARRAGLTSPHDVFAYLLLGPEELEAFTAGSPDNTDDNARIEFTAPRDLLGFAKFDPYLAKVYGPLWPYGRLSEIVDGYAEPGRSAKCGRLARSLLAHGKAREAELWARRAEAAGSSPEAEHVRLLLDLVSTRLDRDPEIPLAPEAVEAGIGGHDDPGDLDGAVAHAPNGSGLEPPVVPAKVAAARPDLVERVKTEYPQIIAAVGARRYATAYEILNKWPEPLWTGMGKDYALLSGFLEYKAEFYNDAVDDLRPLSEDAAFVARRPETLYYLGRAYYANASYVKATDALERYVKSQRILARPLLPASAPPRPQAAN